MNRPRSREKVWVGQWSLPSALFSFSLLIFTFFSAFAGNDGSLDSLRRDFANPPPEARLQAWWHWHGDNVPVDKLLKDLDALRDFGVGTVHIFCAYATYETKPFWKRMLTDDWLDVFRAVLKRAKENGQTVGFHNCPGWSSSGGPWMDVEHSMKVLVFSERDLAPDETTVVMPLPRAVYRGFFRDVALMAVPAADDPSPASVTGSFTADFAGFAAGRAPLALPIAERGSTASLTCRFAEPTPAFATLDLDFDDITFRTPVKVEVSPDGASWTTLADTRLHFYRTTLTTKSVPLAPAPAGSRFYRVSFAYVDAPPHILHIDLRLRRLAFRSPKDAEGARAVTAALAPDGRVDMAKAALPALPAGRHWRLLRFGYTSTGAFNKPATVSGLECDKLDRSGIEAHWPHMPGFLATLPESKGVLKYCIIDSYEAGDQNWTAKMPERFRALRGYDLLPYLPALAGYSLGGERTARFLGDFKRTVSDLFRTEYYGRFAELCRETGYTSVVEGYDGPYDPLEIAQTPDIPAGEFWLAGSEAGNANVDETPTWAASAAHLAGKSRVAAEAFTTDAKPGRWQATPAQLRQAGDRAWLNGISQIVYHSYVAQILDNVKPGFSLSHHGTQLNRHTTWWSEGRCWSDYVARGQALLQAGKNHAEFLVLSGEGHPYACREYPADIIAAGCNFDWIPASMLSRLIVAPDGKVGLPGLPPYEAVLVGNDRTLSLKTVSELLRLQLAGVRLAGRRPLDTPTLADDWGRWNHVVNEVFPSLPCSWRELGVRPFADSRGRLRARRRDVGETVVYYLLNESEEVFDDEVSFVANADARVELWTAEDGSARPCHVRADGANRVVAQLRLEARHSAFAVVSQACRPAQEENAAAKGLTALPTERELDISRDWAATFEGTAAPQGIVKFPTLSSWSESDDPRLKYFAGHARYRKAVNIPAASSVRIDLGRVCELAVVRVNGVRVGTLWQAPFVADITKLVREGKNEIEIEVVNTWPNRLIGDAIFRRDHPEAEKMADPKIWHAWEAKNVDPPKGREFPEWVLADRPDSGTGIWTWSNFGWAWSPDEPLLPAGLLGPVRLLWRGK